MRRSQAPSCKPKNQRNNYESSENSPKLQSTVSDSFMAVRSTENVLNLLLNSKNFINDINVSETDTNFELDSCSRVKNSSGREITISNDTSKTSCQDSQPKITIYNVVYGKQTKKKHKTWEGDGTLEIESKYLILKDEEGKVIGTLPCSKARKLEEGERLYIGNKEVELLDLAEEKSHSTNEKKKIETVVKSDVVKVTIQSRKPLILGKRFISPKFNYSSEMALPEPSTEHQWYFNKNNLPVTPVYIEQNLSNKLRQHQYFGVSFLYECIMGFKKNYLTGAILADEMGLGKTLQCITLIWTLLRQGPYGNKPVINKVLIVTPSSLIMNWHNEFLKWLGRVRLVPFVVNQKNKASNFTGSVMIISYEMLMRCFEDVEKYNFDLLICDEGHRLKNSNIRINQLLNQLNCSRRIILTGTPIQNDLQEFYTLVNFVNPNVLGSPSEFRRRFEEPILAARQPDTDEETLERGRQCALDLKRITSMFLLRRTKDVLKNYLPPRNEIVVFCKITQVQKTLYNSMIDSYMGVKDNVLGISDGCAHLELITALKKLCSHPSLLRKNKGEQNSINLTYEVGNAPMIEASSKVLVTVNFFREMRENSPKEKAVLVSNSTQTLDLLEKIFELNGFITCRLDGSTPTAQRIDIVERFNRPHSNIFIFLLSSKAGGVGLNLTGASRLVLFDLDWNPATDRQAISRIWRDGQKYPVYIYRFLTTGTIEEKIYQRQISKEGLCEGIVDPEIAKSIKLSKEELKDIFSPCEIGEDCLTHNALSCDCSKQGEIPVPEVEPEERSCQLMKQTNSNSSKINGLFHWEHHGRPFDSEFLSELCLKNSQQEISFIFRNSENSMPKRMDS